MMVSTRFLIQNKKNRDHFLKENFLFANINIEVVICMPFLFLSNMGISFREKLFDRLTWRFYSTAKTLLTIYHVKLIDKKEMCKSVIDKNSKTFLIYLVALAAKTFINLLQIAQIAIL